ncbi:MAG: cation:proton antiporter subunit C [Clostridia bacterium]
MGPNLLNNYYETASMILFGIGFTTMLLQPNLIKKVIGLNIMDGAVYLFLASKGYIEERVAPIIVDGVTDVEKYINPVPSGLVLTGIVVSVSITAVLLALIQKLYHEFGTLDIDEIQLQACSISKEEE